MDAQQVIELQNRIVRTMASGIAGVWDAAVVSVEIETSDEDQCVNCLALSFEFQQGAWERTSFSVPHDCYDLFVALRDSSDGPQWVSCLLEFDAKGKYKFSYSFAPAKRLNWIRDDEAMLKDYSPSSL